MTAIAKNIGTLIVRKGDPFSGNHLIEFATGVISDCEVVSQETESYSGFYETVFCSWLYGEFSVKVPKLLRIGEYYDLHVRRKAVDDVMRAHLREVHNIE